MHRLHRGRGTIAGEGKGTVYRSVLAVIDPGPKPDPALDRAIAEARAARARLTLLCAVPPPCGLVCFASVCRETLHAEALAACDRDLRAVVSRLPADLPVTTVLAPVSLRRAVRREVARGGHDLVVIGAAAPRWWSALATRRCPAPVLRATVPAPAHRRRVAAPLAGAG
jgi:nucleotide-binding universal stress UspA family protein